MCSIKVATGETEKLQRQKRWLAAPPASRHARDKLNSVSSHRARLRIDVIKLVGKVKRHYTGTVSICTSEHLSGSLLDSVVVGTSRDLSPRVVVFSDERKPERPLHHDGWNKLRWVLWMQFYKCRRNFHNILLE